jgi:cell shape-determining protein MreD
MSEKSTFFVAMLGLILTMFGVGGIEQSITNTELLSSLAVSVLGLALMAVGVLALKQLDI